MHKNNTGAAPRHTLQCFSATLRHHRPAPQAAAVSQTIPTQIQKSPTKKRKDPCQRAHGHCERALSLVNEPSSGAQKGARGIRSEEPAAYSEKEPSAYSEKEPSAYAHMATCSHVRHNGGTTASSSYAQKLICPICAQKLICAHVWQAHLQALSPRPYVLSPKS
jgi:hypothetical protein